MDAEYTIIDDDILEDRFEDFTGTFDRFKNVLVCNPSGICYHIVPYIYARNITGVREIFEVTTLDRYPTFNEYAVRNELLLIKVRNPEIIFSLIGKQERIIPSLYEEMKELQQLDMLNNSEKESISGRLINFFNTIKVGNYDGDGIFWLPENYNGDENEDGLEQEDNENYEDYIRRVICTHIKCRRLPMIHLLQIEDDKSAMVMDLIDTLSDDKPALKAQLTHYVPLFRNRSDISTGGLRTLMAEEFRCIKNEEMVDGNSSFIFSDKHLDICRETIKVNEARNNLRYYVGDYFDDLDLSYTFITGSSITASIINTGIYDIENRELMIDLLYPKIITQLSREHAKIIKNDNINIWNIEAVTATEGVISKGNVVYPFTIKPGSDVDLAIDNTVDDDMYRTIALGHYETIRRYYPYVKISEYTKPKGDWNYLIYTDDPAYVPVFRTVEIYRSSFRTICSHHVGAVRGCYTSKWSLEPQFYLTASAVYTSSTHHTPNYHYFAGKKSNPQDVIIKNMIRGISISDQVLDGLIRDYINTKNIRISHFPFFNGKNIPYSIFAAPLEYPFVCESRREKRERKERKERTQREREANAQRLRERREQRQREQTLQQELTAQSTQETISRLRLEGDRLARERKRREEIERNIGSQNLGKRQSNITMDFGSGISRIGDFVLPEPEHSPQVFRRPTIVQRLLAERMEYLRANNLNEIENGTESSSNKISLPTMNFNCTNYAPNIVNIPPIRSPTIPQANRSPTIPQANYLPSIPPFRSPVIPQVNRSPTIPQANHLPTIPPIRSPTIPQANRSTAIPQIPEIVCNLVEQTGVEISPSTPKIPNIAIDSTNQPREIAVTQIPEIPLIVNRLGEPTIPQPIPQPIPLVPQPIPLVPQPIPLVPLVPLAYEEVNPQIPQIPQIPLIVNRLREPTIPQPIPIVPLPYEEVKSQLEQLKW